MAQVTPQDLVIDLGAGDGRIAIAARSIQGRDVYL
jgi:predicted RNA methylase